MRILFSSTANDGHFGPLLPFVRACTASGHEVRVAAPTSYGAALIRAGLQHQPFADAPPEVIGPVMASLPTMSVQDADGTVVREVFARIDAQAALPSLVETIERWRPHLVVRESAEVGSLAAAERAGVPHVQVCIGMHEAGHRLAELIAVPLEELGRLAGMADGHLSAALAAEPIVSLVPELLDYASGEVLPGADAIQRFHEPAATVPGHRPVDWGDPDLPLIYVTFDQVINGQRVAAVGAGLTTGQGPGNVARGAQEIPRLLQIPTYAGSARRVAAALRALPPPSEVVPFLTDLVDDHTRTEDPRPSSGSPRMIG